MEVLRDTAHMLHRWSLRDPLCSYKTSGIKHGYKITVHRGQVEIMENCYHVTYFLLDMSEELKHEAR